MTRVVTCAALALTLVAGCPDDEMTEPDATTDSGADGGDGGSLPWPGDGPPVVLPSLTPCPDGWREIADGDLATCEPYPESGWQECPRGEAHFVGSPGCELLGAPCPLGDFADGLPADGSVVYVRSGATGGDGSETAPFGSLDDVDWSTLVAGTTVALSKGSHPGVVSIRPGVALIGACAGETLLTGGLATNLATITAFLPGDPSIVRDLSISRPPHAGVRVEAGANLELSAVVVEESAIAGVFARDEGSLLTLDNVVITRTHRDSSTTQGRGLGVQFGGRIEAKGIILDRNTDGAIFGGGADAAVVLEDAYIRGTASSDEEGQRGVQLQDGATFTARRTLFEGNREIGLFAGRAGSRIILEDTIVRTTHPRMSDGVFGRAINVQDGADLSMTRVLVERNYDVSIVIAQPETTATLEDVVVRDTLPEMATSGFGRGMSVQEGANVVASRVLFERNHDVSIFVTDDDSTLTLADATVRDTRPRASDDAHGYGIQAQITGRLSGSRVIVTDSHGLGISGLFASVTLDDTLVSNTRLSACAATTCPDETFGYGIATISGMIEVDTFAVRAAATCGVFVAGGVGELDLANGVVMGSEIGACVQIDGYDFSRLTNDVLYRDNRINLESTSLPVPDAIDPSR